MNKYFFSGLLLALCASAPVGATEYIYRDLMANTLPGHCDVASKAQDASAKDYKVRNSSKVFCQRQGYGWHLDEIKTSGNTTCKPCGDGAQQTCYQEDVVVACKRIKPGTVGMLPGKG